MQKAQSSIDVIDVRRRCMCAGVLAVFIVACAAVDIIWTPILNAAPIMVYVADFDLDVAEGASGSARPRLPAIGPLARRQGDPQSEARHLVDLMSRSIVEDLERAGLTAQRLPRNASMPYRGWLVRGVFLEVDQGNRLRRAVVGFGAGQTEMQVAATADDLSKGEPAPLFDIDTSAQSGGMPGAAVTLNPIAAGVRFVMAGHDLERNVRECAAKVAEEVERRVRGAPAH